MVYTELRVVVIWVFGRLCSTVALVVLLAACGGDDDVSDAGGASTSPPDATATTPSGSPIPDASPSATSVRATATPTSEPTATASRDLTATPPEGTGEALEYEKLAAWEASWESLGVMALGPDGRLYVDDYFGNVLTVYDTDGSELGTIEYESSVPPPLGLRNDIAIGPDGRLYLLEASAGARVLVYESDGTLVAEWGGTFPVSPFDEASLFDAEAIAVAPDGHVFVAGGGGGQLQKFTSDGEFIAAWDRAGDYLFPGATHDMDIAGDRLYVAAESYRGDQSVILTFDFDGNLIGEPIVLAEPDTEPRIYPGSLAVGPDGNLFVADPITREIIVLSPAGEILTRWTLEGEGEAPAYFLEVVVDDDGRVYVADDLTKMIVVFGTTTGNTVGELPNAST